MLFIARSSKVLSNSLIIKHAQLHFSFRLFSLAEHERHVFLASSVMLPTYPPVRHIERSDAIAPERLYQDPVLGKPFVSIPGLWPWLIASRLGTQAVNFERNSVFLSHCYSRRRFASRDFDIFMFFFAFYRKLSHGLIISGAI